MKETLYGAPLSAPFDGTGALWALVAMLAIGIVHHVYKKDRLYWKAFWLYVAGMMAICNCLIFLAGLFLWWMILGIPENFGTALLALLTASFLAGLVVASIAITTDDPMGNREQKLRGIAEEGRRMCIYGNPVGFVYLLYRVVDRMCPPREKRFDD